MEESGAAYFTILVFALGAIAVVLGGLLLAALLRPHEPHPEKEIPYECGEDPIGTAHVRYNIRFFLVALVFLIFDVEIVLTVPVAVVFRKALGSGLALFVFIEILVFMAILFLALLYVWARGDLDWIRTVRRPRGEGPERTGGIRQ